MVIVTFSRGITKAIWGLAFKLCLAVELSRFVEFSLVACMGDSVSEKGELCKGPGMIDVVATAADLIVRPH